MPGHSPIFPKAPAPPVDAEQANAEHGVQMGLIKAAIGALQSGEAEADALVEQLHDYTEMHFMSEALLMRMSARPNYEAHLAEHERMLVDLAEIRSLLDRNEASGAEQRLRVHEKDVLDHICSWDRSI
jgi:hemerythrin-like metal-binding protein